MPSATWPIDLDALPPDCAQLGVGHRRRQGHRQRRRRRIDLDVILARQHRDALAQHRRLGARFLRMLQPLAATTAIISNAI